MSERPFRTLESIESERETRDRLKTFLEQRGFERVKDRRKGKAQAIDGIAPWGETVRMAVRLCWRRPDRGRNSARVRKYAAAQLLSRIEGDDWEGTLEGKVQRERDKGVIHFLVVQADRDDIKYAALIPLAEIVPIWKSQRDVSRRLIAQGKLGRRTKNHAMNGTSPTIWLQDDRGAKEVADALWGHQDVKDLAVIIPQFLSPDEADRSKEDGETPFEPEQGDRRAKILRQITDRRGGQKFRDSLRKRYGDCCLVTGCQIVDILEAAHIKPYRGESDNSDQNGLLLRADIHTLFDLNLLGIDPEQLVVKLHPTVQADEAYAWLEGARLRCASDHRPSYQVLEARFKDFNLRLARAVR